MEALMSNSLAKIVSNPANSNPLSIPPTPAKNEAHFKFIILKPHIKNVFAARRKFCFIISYKIKKINQF